MEMTRVSQGYDDMMMLFRKKENDIDEQIENIWMEKRRLLSEE